MAERNRVVEAAIIGRGAGSGGASCVGFRCRSYLLLISAPMHGVLEVRTIQIDSEMARSRCGQAARAVPATVNGEDGEPGGTRPGMNQGSKKGRH